VHPNNTSRLARLVGAGLAGAGLLIHAKTVLHTVGQRAAVFSLTGPRQSPGLPSLRTAASQCLAAGTLP
jgi:hypothetical protein